MKISVVIPVYKNKEMFLNFLKHNLQFLHDAEVIVVNDDPTESIKKDVGNFKNVKLIENTKNLGFSGTVNIGVEKASGDYLLLLNSDVKLIDSSYRKALQLFEKDKELFAVSFAQKEKDGSTVGKNKIYWKKGFFQHSKANDLQQGINGWAEGGAALLSTEKFRKLKGFDPIFSPFYWEDIDLSYRAWKKGWTVLFEPSVIVEHHHESTIRKFFEQQKVDKIAFRNQLLFIWKNINTSSFMFSHFIALVQYILVQSLKGKWYYVQAVGDALQKITTEHFLTPQQKLTDTEILNKFN